MAPELTRILTGVPELDAVLRGGLLRQRIHLIEGRPGTGKTTLGLRYLIDGVQHGERCLYLSLSETAGRTAARRRPTTAGRWTASASSRCCRCRPTAPPAQTILLPTETELSALVDRIADLVDEGRRRTRRDRLDGRDPPAGARQRPLPAPDHRPAPAPVPAGATVLLLDDLTSDGQEFELQSAVHGVITLEQIERSFGAARRRMRVVKLRGGDFQSGWHDYAIQHRRGAGLPQPDRAGTPPRRRAGIEILSGVERLRRPVRRPADDRQFDHDARPVGRRQDDAGAAVRACRRCGPATTSAISPSTNRKRRCARASWRTWAAATTARAGRRRTRAAPVPPAPRESVAHLAGRIHLERAPPGRGPGRAPDHHRQHQLLPGRDPRGKVAAAADERTVFLPEQHERDVDHRSAPTPRRLDTSKEPDALSIITDNIISLRYYERDNVVRKAICVLKKRQGRHAHEICALHLTDEGMRIGARIDIHGRATGRRCRLKPDTRAALHVAVLPRSPATRTCCRHVLQRRRRLRCACALMRSRVLRRAGRPCPARGGDRGRTGALRAGRRWSAVLRRQADMVRHALAGAGRRAMPAAIDTDRFARLAGIGNVTLLSGRRRAHAVDVAALGAAARAACSSPCATTGATSERTPPAGSGGGRAHPRAGARRAGAAPRRAGAGRVAPAGVARPPDGRHRPRFQQHAAGDVRQRDLAAHVSTARTWTSGSSARCDSIRRAAEQRRLADRGSLLAYARRQPLSNVTLDLRGHLQRHRRNAAAHRSARTSHLRLAPARRPVAGLADPSQLDAALF